MYLTDFKSDYIHAHQDVERTMTKMKISVPYTFKKVCLDIPIFENEDNELKIGYININSLFTGKSDLFINNDRNLLKLDILCIADTRLSEKDMSKEVDAQLSNWRVLCRYDAIEISGKIHMGLLLLQSKASLNSDMELEWRTKQWIKGTDTVDEIIAQSIVLKCPDYDVTFMYIRETPTFNDVKRINETTKHSKIIMGDLNLDANG